MSTTIGSAEYDLIVLGGGAVGENIADRAVQGGLTAVIVENEPLIPKPHGEPMTLLTQRPEASSTTTETTLKSATATTVANTAVRGGSYVTLPAGSVPAGVEGSYVTVADARNLPPVYRGSYVTVDGTPVVATSVIEGSYVTIPTAA